MTEPNFAEFRDAIKAQFDEMRDGRMLVYRADISKDELYDIYLTSFPEGSNEIRRERREHDCTYCKQFIRAVGDMIAIVDGKFTTLWDVDVPYPYTDVAAAMAAAVKAAGIKNIFLHTEKSAGVHSNKTQSDEQVITFNHFHIKLPKKLVCSEQAAGPLLSEARSTYDVLKRSLNEITVSATETVLELIGQNSLHRGDQYEHAVREFKSLQGKYDLRLESEYELFLWEKAVTVPQSISRIRGTAIGSLLIDLSEGRGLDEAVGSFESKVSGGNYQRTSAVATKGMIMRAEKRATELGFHPSMPRRHATTEDITVNNVLYADRSAKPLMKNAFEQLAAETPSSKNTMQTLDKVEEVSLDTFVTEILPTASSVEVMVENRHAPNFVSLLAPVNAEAPCMLKWLNNFSWSYAGEVADSIKENVKAAGGSVTGVLRFSIQWNDDADNRYDLDAHVIEPDGNHIFFENKKHRHPSSAILDVDIIRPGNDVAVENITWSDLDKMHEGTYRMFVINYSSSVTNKGFKAQLEYDGVTYEYEYQPRLSSKANVTVAAFRFTRANGIEFIESLDSSMTSKDVWGIQTNEFHKVRMIMNSPNYWDEQKTGTRHLFFVVEDCKQLGSVRGFYNEFLTDKLREDRKVFELLGARMRAEETDNQLSGLGFSCTRRNSVCCRVLGAFSRVVKVMF